MKLDRKIVAFGLITGMLTLAMQLLLDWLLIRKSFLLMDATFAAILAIAIIVIKTRQANKEPSPPDA